MKNSQEQSTLICKLNSNGTELKHATMGEIVGFTTETSLYQEILENMKKKKYHIRAKLR